MSKLSYGQMRVIYQRHAKKELSRKLAAKAASNKKVRG